MSKNYSFALIGCRVRIRDSVRYHGACSGHEGVVRAVYDLGQSISIKLDDMSHESNLHGCFYFPIEELDFIAPEDTETTKEKGGDNVKTLTDYLNIAEMQFIDEKTPFRTYDYANYDPSVQQGDVCVVATAHHGLALAEVVQVKSETAEAAICREIVCKVDTSEYDSRIEQRKKLAELKAKMQERAKKLQDIVLFQTLAKDDPEMAQLLSEYMGLNK